MHGAGKGGAWEEPQDDDDNDSDDAAEDDADDNHGDHCSAEDGLWDEVQTLEWQSSVPSKPPRADALNFQGPENTENTVNVLSPAVLGGTPTSGAAAPTRAPRSWCTQTSPQLRQAEGFTAVLWGGGGLFGVSLRGGESGGVPKGRVLFRGG